MKRLTIQEYCSDRDRLELFLTHKTFDFGITVYMFKQNIVNKKREGKIHIYNCYGYFAPGYVHLSIHPTGKYLFIANNCIAGVQNNVHKCSAFKNNKSHLSFSATNEIIKFKKDNGGCTYKTVMLSKDANETFGFHKSQQVLVVLLNQPINKSSQIDSNKLTVVKIAESVNILQSALTNFGNVINSLSK